MHAEESLVARRTAVLRAHLTAAATLPCGRTPLCTQGCKAEVQSDTLHKVTTATEAAKLVQDGATVTVAGFVGIGFPEYLVNAVRKRFDETQQPRSMHLVQVAACGDGKGRGMDKWAAEGMVASMTYGWAGMSPALLKLIQKGSIQGWNLPLGVMSHLIRDTAAKRPGPVTRIGLGTFVDPREGGGKCNGASQQDKVHLMHVGGQELLFYEAPKSIDIALLRGSTADLDGNVSFEHEALYLDNLNQALAAHNSGGKVIVQVERLVDKGTIPTRDVHLPGAIVDKIVVAPASEHWQSLASPAYDGSLSGEVRAPSSSIKPLPMNERKVIAHRAMLAIDKPHAIVNLGIGMPEGVSTVATTHGHHNPQALPINLTTEAGSFGGVPVGGLRFGAGHNSAAHLPCSSMIDFYNGGGVDVAILGMAEVDQEGNVNVSYFPPRTPGCGGFIDISQTAKRVIFVGTFTSGGLKVHLEGGKLRIDQEGKNQKFTKRVRQKTFGASTANGRTILYITERAVFKLAEGKGLELLEAAPGVDVDKDILGQMGFKPVMKDVKTMDQRVFKP